MQLQSLQIALFFKELINERPDLQFKVFIEKFSDVFDNMPTQFPIPPGTPTEIPFMILNSKNNLNSCSISRSRIDFITTDKNYMDNEELIISYLEEISKVQDIFQFGFVSTYFEEKNDASSIIRNKFLIIKEEIKDVSIRFNKQLKINKEVYNCHFSISDISQQNIYTQTVEKGLLMQKDINNVLLNTKNEVLTSSKLKSLFKGSIQTLYTSDIDAK